MNRAMLHLWRYFFSISYYFWRETKWHQSDLPTSSNSKDISTFLVRKIKKNRKKSLFFVKITFWRNCPKTCGIVCIKAFNIWKKYDPRVIFKISFFLFSKKSWQEVGNCKYFPKKGYDSRTILFKKKLWYQRILKNEIYLNSSLKVIIKLFKKCRMFYQTYSMQQSTNFGPQSRKIVKVYRTNAFSVVEFFFRCNEHWLMSLVLIMKA